jgi:tetratricopeptide (TPR) repeat protein
VAGSAAAPLCESPASRATSNDIDLGGIDAAIEPLAHAAEAHPDDALAQARWADALLDLAEQGRRGAEREARARLQRALDLDPRSSEALLVESRLRARAGEWDGVRDAVRRAAASGRPEATERAFAVLITWAAGLAERDDWRTALALWREAAAVAPVRAVPALVEVLRAQQDVLLAPPRWSWLVHPPAPDRRRSLEYAALGFVAAVACLALFVFLAGSDATLILSLVPCAGIALAPGAVWWLARRRLRERAAPHAAAVAAIRADPARLFRGEPPLPTVLAALEYVATERHGRAISLAHPWLLGQASPAARRARRAAWLQAPWMPRGDEPDAPRQR